MIAEETSWRNPAFRQCVVAKIDETIQKSGNPTSKNSIEMENYVFQKAKTKDEYFSFVARLILCVREMNAKKGVGGMNPGGGQVGGQGMPDPIGALQTLARQGTGNNQVMPGLPGGGPNPQGIPQQAPNAATNQLQSLNQRPGPGMNIPYYF